MDIYGLQKLTLLDYPGKTACTVFVGGCNFACPFCHNSELAFSRIPPIMHDEELLEFLKSRVGLLDGVVISGGEPTIKMGLVNLLREIRDLGFSIKLDTNGYNPGMLEYIIEEHLVDYVAMDIKNGPSHYAETAGLDIIDMVNIKCSIALLMKENIDYEFRTTVVDEYHDEDSFNEIGELISGAKRYYLQPFVDCDTVLHIFHTPPEEALNCYLNAVKPYVGSVELRGI